MVSAELNAEREKHTSPDVAEAEARTPREHEATDREKMIEEVEAFRRRVNNQEFVLHPASKRVQKWDAITFFGLIFTAIVTPVEVSFVNEHQKSLDALFVTNRVIDLVFLFDVYMQFVVCYYSKANDLLIKSRRLIAKRYLAGWFVPDLISCVPVDILAVCFTSNNQKKLLRLLRMLRLLKLIRVARAKRIIGRWRAAGAVFVLPFTEAQISMIMLITEVFFFSHLIACMWGFSAHESFAGRESRTWLGAFSDSMTDGDGRKQFREGSTAEKYSAALYFAIFTMTGIGYGDITPTNHGELATCIGIMLSAAMFWAFMIGNICSIASLANMHESSYRLRTDQLNSMMKDQDFPPELQRRCRLFLMNSREYQRTAAYPELFQTMSTTLSGEMSAAVNGSWLRGVWYFKDASRAFLFDLSSIIERKMYAPTEVIEKIDTLFVLRSGVVARRSRVLSKGAAWGVDFLLRQTEFIDRVCAAALSYAEVLCVSREEMLILLDNPDYSPETRTILGASKWYLFRSQAVRLGELMIARRSRQRKPRLTFNSVSCSTNDRHDLLARVAERRSSRPSAPWIANPLSEHERRSSRPSAPWIARSLSEHERRSSRPSASSISIPLPDQNKLRRESRTSDRSVVAPGGAPDSSV